MFRLFLLLLINFGLLKTSRAQALADVRADTAIIKAGEAIRFSVRVDRPTSLEDCEIAWFITKSGLQIYQTSVPLPLGETKVTISYKTAYDLEGGHYELGRLVFISPGGKQIPLSFPKVGFDVIANQGIQYPSSAEVAINPSQVQLFRTEAAALAQRAQGLKDALAGLRPKGSQALTIELRNAVVREIAAVSRTSERFSALGGSVSVSRTAAVFFADLQLTYQQLLTGLDSHSSVGLRQQRSAALIMASLGRMQEPEKTPPAFFASQAVYRALEQNELAYSLVADTGDLSFSLTVVSSPEGATISYARRGDRFQSHPDPTKTIINSLPLAIWTFHFHKEGFQDQERNFNPFVSRDHILDVTLAATRR